MEALGWIVWVFVAFLGVTFSFGIIRKLRHGQGVQKATILQTVGIVLTVFVFLFAGWNKLHIIWVVIVLFLISSIYAYSSGWRSGTRQG